MSLDKWQKASEDDLLWSHVAQNINVFSVLHCLRESHDDLDGGGPQGPQTKMEGPNLKKSPNFVNFSMLKGPVTLKLQVILWSFLSLYWVSPQMEVVY